jgi:hypothetical protein
MSSVNGLVAPAEALATIANVLGYYGTLIALIVGLVGWVSATRDPGRQVRFRRMAIAGALGHVVIIGVDALYATIRFIMGTEFLPDGWPYGASLSGSGESDLILLSEALSGLLYHLGLAIFIIGITAWAFRHIGREGSLRSNTGVTLGLVMIATSIGGNLFSVFAYILL